MLFIKNLNSPRSLSIIKELSTAKKLIYELKNPNANNQKLKSQSQRFENEYHFNKEKLEKSKSQGNILRKKQKMFINSPQISPSNAYYMNFPLYGKKSLKNRKNLTDFWSFRYDKEKEDEQIYFLKKQNLSQIKNLIDKTLTLREKGKFKNHLKYVKKEEEKSILQKEYFIQRDKAIKEHEKYEKQLDEAIKNKKEKDFIKDCIQQRKNEEMKEKKIKEFQEKLFERQKEWESKNFEHMEKVENMYQQKHISAINEYQSILKKDVQRHEKIEERKNQFDLKNKIRNQKRFEHYVNYKNKTIEDENQMRKKLEQKYRNISQFYSLQQEKKKNIFQSQRKIREEKIASNVYNRILNKNKEIERRKRLLDLFEKNEEKVEKKFMLKEKQHEQYKLNNLLKSDEITGNYLRNMDIIKNKNRLKLQKMKNKDIEVNNKIIKRQNSAQQRISRYDELKASKNSILNYAKNLLEEQKEYQPQDIYKKVFTKEEINILNE